MTYALANQWASGSGEISAVAWESKERLQSENKVQSQECLTGATQGEGKGLWIWN